MKRNDNTKEEWKPVDGFPNYEVSNLGNLRNKTTGRVFGGTRDAFGYIHVRIPDASGKFTLRKVHRLVAEAFLSNPDCLPVVDHIDGDKSNNRLDNLRWVSYRQNSEAYLEKNGPTRGVKRPVAMYALDGSLLKQFRNTAEAEAATGVRTFTIYQAARGSLKTAGGYMWRFYDTERGPEDSIAPREDARLQAVRRIMPDGTETVYESVAKAAAAVKKDSPDLCTGSEASAAMVIRYCMTGTTKTAYGCVWRYVW